MYNFLHQKMIGKTGETILDVWLKERYKIIDVSALNHFQERCVDRIVERSDRSTFLVEYKLDAVAKRSQNIFFETMSVDAKNIPGWGWNTQADYLLILVPDQEILILKPGNLRLLIWQQRHTLQEKLVPNLGYKTIGFPISLKKVREIAFHVERITTQTRLKNPPDL